MSSAGFRLRCTRTVRGKPLLTRFFAMPWPISPRPMNPTRGLSLLMFVSPKERLRSDWGNSTASIHGCRLGLRQVRAPALVPGEHDAAARDDDDPDQSPAVGECSEDEPSC